MFKMLIIVPLTALILSACVASPDYRSGGVVVAPVLPVVVRLGGDPYYYHSGYHYYYNNNIWRYSNARNGPWTNLPRSHYPRETRFYGHSGDRGRYNGRINDNRGKYDGRAHDNRGKYNGRANDNRGRDGGRNRDNREQRR